MNAYGVQVLGELYECDPGALNDEGLIRRAMLEAARRAGATIVTDFVHRFSPHGVSGVVVIAESHLSIHTWPEHGYAAVDLFTCGEALRPEEGLLHLVEALGSRRHTLSTARRGPGPSARATITVIDCGAGDTEAVLAPLVSWLEQSARVHRIHLASETRRADELAPLLVESDGLVFASGADGGSWGSPLQAFVEQAARFEGGRTWLGKPAAVVVTVQGAGGEGIVSRLQGVLCAMGCAIPPMSGMACSLATESASFLDDLGVIGHNLLEAARGGSAWRTWRVAEVR